MDNFELLLRDLEAILKTIGEVNYVSHGKAVPVSEEDTFTSVYIAPTADSFTPFTQGTSANVYDNYIFIRLLVNMDCTSDGLLWLSTRRKIIDAVLDDTAIWNVIVDRDIVSSVYDDYGSHPKRSMELMFEFRIRENCT